jgi:hypothetical protein
MSSGNSLYNCLSSIVIHVSHIILPILVICRDYTRAARSYHSTHLFYFLELPDCHWEDNDFLNLCCMKETDFYLFFY